MTCCGKNGLYPDSWVENIDKLDQEGLPPQAAFSSSLTPDNSSFFDEQIKNLDRDTIMDTNRTYAQQK